MILGFKQYFDKEKKQPTYFREKILLNFGYGVLRDTEGEESVIKPTKYHLEVIKTHGGIKPKLHTIRTGNRWKAGDLIHMAYGVQTKNYQQFNKGIPELERVKSVQNISIKWLPTHKDEFRTLLIAVDGRLLDPETEYPKVILNDGFDSVEPFIKWFDKDFTGQIIHWTDLKY